MTDRIKELRQKIREDMQDYELLHRSYKQGGTYLFDDIDDNNFSFFSHHLIRSINDDLDDLKQLVEGDDDE